MVLLATISGSEILADAIFPGQTINLDTALHHRRRDAETVVILPGGILVAPRPRFAAALTHPISMGARCVRGHRCPASGGGRSAPPQSAALTRHAPRPARSVAETSSWSSTKLLVIAGAALCALLVAAANFAGLMLARVVERDGEMALRSALGATRGRLIREGLVQALVLAAFGTVLGLLVAGWLTPALVALSPEGADATGSAIREFDYAWTRLALVRFCRGSRSHWWVLLLPAWRASLRFAKRPRQYRACQLGKRHAPLLATHRGRDRDLRALLWASDPTQYFRTIVMNRGIFHQSPIAFTRVSERFDSPMRVDGIARP